MTKIYRKVFPYILQLACDVEKVILILKCTNLVFFNPLLGWFIKVLLKYIISNQVTEQLFRPLVFQMIHWFTRNTQYESPDTIALLDAILVS